MSLRMLLRFLNDQYVVEKLSNTTLMRRFAQLTHYSYLRLSSWGNKRLNNLSDSSKAREQFEGKSQTSGRLISFTKTFFENIQKEIEGSQLGKRK